MAENIVLAVQSRFGIALQTSILLEAPSARELARIVDRMVQPARVNSLVVPVVGSTGYEPMAMIHGMSGSALYVNRLGPQLAADYRLYAIRGMGLEYGEDPLDSVEEITDTYLHEANAVCGKAPRVIGGICLGGLIAVEMARKLYDSTGERRALVLIDPPPMGSAWLKPASDNRMTDSRIRQMDRQVRFWRTLRDVLDRLNLGRSVAGRKARRETFKKSLTRAVAGFAPPQFPCDLLLIASSEWGAETIDEYRAWATDDTTIKTVTIPGRHGEFQRSNRVLIDREITGFLAAHTRH